MVHTLRAIESTINAGPGVILCHKTEEISSIRATHAQICGCPSSFNGGGDDVVTAERLEYFDNLYLNFSSGLKRYSIRDGVETAARNRLSCSDDKAGWIANLYSSYLLLEVTIIVLSKPAIQSIGPATWTPRISEYECFLHDSSANAGVDTIRANIPPWSLGSRAFIKIEVVDERRTPSRRASPGGFADTVSQFKHASTGNNRTSNRDVTSGKVVNWIR
ncbi:hypothetical protein BKA82DRAFT_4020991 [Pisolithus tinctorius]|nr:hypothetical protein BKA82DRAFT_4020991 [Pisolithus tinctorius]